MKPTSEKSHFVWLDAARGLAAMAVMFWHYQHFYYPSHMDATTRSLQPLYHYFKPFFDYGALAVQFFWVISGFVFAHVYLHKKISTYNFFVKRFTRLYPLHFITLNIVLILQLLSFNLFGEYQIYKANDLYHYILNLFFASYWGLQKDFSFNAPIWSVSVEVLIYTFFWVTLLTFRRIYFRIALFSMVMFFTVWKMDHLSVIMECGFYFFSGCLVFYAWKYLIKETRRALIATSIFVILFIIYHVANGTHTVPFIKLLLFPLITFSLATFDSLSTIKSNKFLTILGDATYGIYLLHIPIQLLLIIILKYFKFNTALIAANPFFLIFYISLCISMAIATFKYVEMPLKNYLNKKMIR